MCNELPIRIDIMPQTAMHPGRYIEGLPIWFRNMLLSGQDKVRTHLLLVEQTMIKAYEGTCIKI